MSGGARILAASQARRACSKAAIVAGWEPRIPFNGSGYWKALRAFCDDSKGKFEYPTPGRSAAKPAPTAADLAAAKREARLAQKRAAERARQARIKAARLA